MKLYARNTLIRKFLRILTNTLILPNSFLHPCWASQYSPFHNAANFPFQNENPGIPETMREAPNSQKIRDAKLDKAIESLCEIQRIHEFDPVILDDTTTNPAPALNFQNMNYGKALPFVKFYSECPEERRVAFEQKIKAPLLSILVGAAEASFKFPSTLQYLEQPRVIGNFQSLLDVAIQDLFAEPTEGLAALADSLQGLKKNKRLSQEQEQSLRLYRNLAGFFYDKKAIEYLSSTTKRVLDVKPDVTQLKDRIALLRIIQLCGETFKLMMPSTLALETAIPDDGLLEALRDKLSHLSKPKVRKLFALTSETHVIFTNVLDEVTRLQTLFISLGVKYQNATDTLSPPQLWTYLKSLNLNRVQRQSTSQWPGIRSLANLLDISPTSTNLSPPLTYETEIPQLAPLPAVSEDHKQYQLKRTETYKVLTRIGNPLKNSPQLRQELLIVGVAVTQERAEEIFTQLFDAQAQRKQLFIANRTQEAEQKKQELCLLKDQIYQELAGITDAQAQIYKDQEQQAKVAQEIQNRLREVLQGIRPCNGFGNLSDKYDEFCDKVRSAGVIVPVGSFDWSQPPQTALERAFHKTHRTGLTSKSDKDSLRRTRIQSVLELINDLRDELDVQTTVEFESYKEGYSRVVSGKARLVSNSIHALKDNNGSALPTFWKIYEALCELENKIKAAVSQGEVTELMKNAHSYIQAFITQYAAYFPSPSAEQSRKIDIIKQELLAQTRGEKAIQMQAFMKREQVKSDHRFHKPTHIENILLAKIKADESRFSTYEFFLSAIYELLKEVSDYPELKSLRDTDQVRNYFFHRDPFELDALIVRSRNTMDGGIYIGNSIGTLAKELAILTINVKFILENFLNPV
ncbi:MAG: hypothetical protein FJX03_03015 [Alphaproteobacteria bacterium]|nr:hypothetical protein [Alphaproteobacteria bacterium]